MENVALPWYRSTIIISALVSIITKILVVSGVISDLSSEDAEALTNTLVLVIGGIADLWAIKSRVVQQEAPKIVSSGKKAAIVTAATVVATDPLAQIPEAQEVLGVQPITFDKGTENG